MLLYNQNGLRLRLIKKRFITDAGEVFCLRTGKADDAGTDCGFEDILATAEAVWSGRQCLWKRGEALWRLRWRRFWQKRFAGR